MSFFRRYPVDYGGREFVFDNAKRSYRAGTRVRLIMSEIATDTDYSFSVEGAGFQVDFEDGYVVSFTMPEHGVRVRVESRNSMEYVPPEEEPEDEE